MPIPHPFDVVIGLDRSDRKADLHLIDTHCGQAYPRGPYESQPSSWRISALSAVLGPGRNPAH